MAVGKPQPVFFATPAELRRWFTANHRKGGELWVGYHKKGSGTPSVDWPQSVDQALCFGWIDGVRKSLGPDSYTIRFTPRKPGSHWSNVNIKRVAELTRMGQMKAAGQQAFEARSHDEVGPVCLRAARPGAAVAGAVAAVQSERGGLEVLPDAGAVVPAHDDLLGGDRQAGSDADPAAGATDRPFRRRRDAAGAAAAGRQ